MSRTERLSRLSRVLTAGALAVVVFTAGEAGAQAPAYREQDPSIVYVSGVVRRLDVNGAEFELRVVTPATTHRARGPIRALDGRPLVDSEVRLAGKWVTISGGRDEPLRSVLWIERASQIHVLVPGAPDPYHAPTIQVPEVLRIRSDEIPLHRVKVAGTVTAQLGRETFYLTSRGHDMEVRLLEPASLAPGDQVETVGYVGRVSSPRILVDAAVRKVGATEPPHPARAAAPRLLSREYHNTLVRVEGTLVRHSIDLDEFEMILQSDGITLEASLPRAKSSKALDELVDGSRVEVTGIAAIRAGADRAPLSLTIRLRDAQDVKLVAPASWWTTQRALYLLGIVVVGLVGAGGWVVALRRRLPEIERARLESEERYRQLFEEAPAGHFLTSPDGTLTACNEAFAQMLGFPCAAAAVGINRDSLYLNAGDREAWLELLRSGTPLDHRKVALRSTDARPVPALETAVARFERGRISEIQGFLIDRTEQERTEAALRERDAQLQQAQKMEAIGRLAGGMAHDFNNLLTAIAGYSELARTECADRPEVVECIQQVEKAAATGAGLTRQLLAFSRKQVFAPTVLDLNEVVASLDNMMRRLVGEDIQMTVRTWYEPLYVKADRVQLEQVLINLAVNARDAMPEGGAVALELSRRDQNVQLVFSDTGCGMDEATCSRIFEPFFTTKEPGRGTGLGLAMVYGAITQGGGAISVRSAPGRGTTFVIALPRVAAPAETPASDEAAQPIPSSGTILLVEDDPGVRTLAQRILEREGYTVLVAADGREALSLAETRPETIDLLLSDVVMPGMSGADVAQWFAAHRPDTRVLLMSGYADHPALKQQPLPIKASLLQKPFTAISLCSAVRKALRAGKSTMDLTSAAAGQHAAG